MSKATPSMRGPFLWMLAAAWLLGAALALPLWQLRMEAPQYREEEALKVAVYPGVLRGDLQEISLLNQYIGVHIPAQLPQLTWLPAALLGAGLAGCGAVFLPGRSRRWALYLVPSLLAAALLAAAVQAQWQMYDIGHRRDQKTALVGVKDFTPPLLGARKIAQFEVTSRLGLGAYVAGAAILLQLAVARSSRKARPQSSFGARRQGDAGSADARRRLPATEPCPALPQSP